MKKFRYNECVICKHEYLKFNFINNSFLEQPEFAL